MGRVAGEARPWTPKQLDAIVAVTTWACRRYDIPPVLIPDSKPGRRGIGYHRLGCDPVRLPGCDKWSNSVGKVCPGNRRIGQLTNNVVPRVARLVGGSFLMALSDQQQEWLYQLAHHHPTPSAGSASSRP